jgi:hypothetical protein
MPGCCGKVATLGVLSRLSRGRIARKSLGGCDRPLNLAPLVKLVRSYDAAEWEIFIAEWQKGLAGYHTVKRLGSGGDLGRDVVGLYSADGCEGDWDNYQCKHYEAPLATPAACEDAGKIIFHAFRGEFSPPKKCSFLAPRGPTTELRDLLLNPSKFKSEVLATWNTRVAKRVVAGQDHKLEGALGDYAEAYNFNTFTYETIEEVLDGHRKTAYWASRFQGALPQAPPGDVPSEIHEIEAVYIGQLLDVYREIVGEELVDVAHLSAHHNWNDDLHQQRVRFYDAEYFVAHYRDQTEPGTVEDFSEQIYDAIEPGLSVPGGTSHQRLTGALTAAGQAWPANVLSSRAKVRVKQGVCHQLANQRRVAWKP